MEHELYRKPSIALLSLLIVSWASTASAEDFYVAEGGDDDASGAVDAPFRTITRAVAVAGAGDQVLVAAGRYQGFQVSEGGTADAPLVFRAMGEVIIDEANPETPHGINLEGADHVVIDGFTVVGAPRVGIRTVLSRGVVIRNNVVEGSGLTGILTGFAYDLLIENNVSSGAVIEHGIYVSNSDEPDDNVIVRGNESFGNGTNGIQFNGDCDDSAGLLDHNVIEDNYVHDNDQKGLSLISFAQSVVRNNVMVDNGLEAGAGGIHLTGEIGCDMPSDDNLVVNNTIVESRITGIRINGQSRGNVVFNNIVVSGRGVSRTLVDEDGGNTIDDVTNIVLADVGDLFVDAGDRDFRLGPDSDARDQGAAAFSGREAPARDARGVARPVGDGWDIGALEACEGAACEPGPEPDAGPPSTDSGTGPGDDAGRDAGAGSDAAADSGGAEEPGSGGGCNASGREAGPTSFLALLMLPFFVRRSRRRTLSRVACTAALLCLTVGCGRFGYDSASSSHTSTPDSGVTPMPDADVFADGGTGDDAGSDGGIGGRLPHTPDPSLRRAWTELSAPTRPPAVACPGLAHDPIAGVSYMYGGAFESGDASDELWSFSGASWTRECAGCAGPGPRAGHALVYDRTRGGVLLFGGVDETGTTRNDTWLYADGAWTELDELVMRPAPRQKFFHAYDEARGVLVVFGGLSARYTQPHEDLWELHADGWRGPFVAVSDVEGPGPRYSCDGGTFADEAALHPDARGRFVIFGGSARDVPDPGDVFDDAWAWGGATDGWQQLCTDCTDQARTNAGVEYDPCTGRVIVTGGYNSRREIAGTWEIGDGEVLQTSGAPLARDSMGVTYDVQRDAILAFGGDGFGCAGRCDETLAMVLPPVASL